MKIVKLSLSEELRKGLEELQNNGSNQLRERSLAVLHCADGKKISWIASALNRQGATIRTWIASFERDGIAGLSRTYSPGRPSVRQIKLKPRLQEYLEHSPRDYGWGEDIWTTAIINEQFEKELKRKFGESTISRLLKDMGYVFKRAKKTVPAAAPSKEEKIEAVKKIASDILEWGKGKDVEVVFLDESHFSTDPYVIRGWHKCGEPFSPSDPQASGKHVGIWSIRSGSKEILLEECTKKQC
ncbi:MAG: hypothetical protein BWY31_03022 [Lentisphaerae bacterium ADurb.Bin242]|nr:MAG: hypothetical protein BWY31_03022 [Lentisphaerae bacterium ADurb.Bin242]